MSTETDQPGQFFDIDGNPVSLDVLCMREPAWAANRIRMGIADIARLTTERDAALAEAAALRATGQDVAHVLDGILRAQVVSEFASDVGGAAIDDWRDLLRGAAPAPSVPPEMQPDERRTTTRLIQIMARCLSEKRVPTAAEHEEASQLHVDWLVITAGRGAPSVPTPDKRVVEFAEQVIAYFNIQRDSLGEYECPAWYEFLADSSERSYSDFVRREVLRAARGERTLGGPSVVAKEPTT